jgi:diguanylate cyclase
MNQNSAKNILKELYNDIVVKIDSDMKTISKDDIIDFLQVASTTISKIDLEQPDAIETLRESLEDNFQKLAEASIQNYSQTNHTFERLTKQQGEAIDELNRSTIDTDQINKKFNDIQLHMMQEVQRANETIQELQNKIDNLHNASRLDHLTQTYNRRALAVDLQNICSSDSKVKDNIFVLAIDIDDFKVVNDTYGHLVGDKVLIFLSNTLRKVLRGTDRVYRYGGEEFLIILTRTQSKECTRIAERLLQAIQNNKLIYKDINIGITISIGITRVIQSDLPDVLLDRVDQSLYEAKRTGKNKIITDKHYEH